MKTSAWFSAIPVLVCLLLVPAAFEAQALERPDEAPLMAALKIQGRCAQYFNQGIQVSVPNRRLFCRARVATYRQLQPHLMETAPLSRYAVYARWTRRPGLTLAGFTGRVLKRGRTNRFAQGMVRFGLVPSRLYLNLRIRAFEPPQTRASMCREIEGALVSDLATMRSCATNEQCGQPIEGLSCGASMRPVARNDADPAGFYERLNQFQEAGCDSTELPTATICMLRETAGFICRNGLCDWRYTEEL